jgi:hypothetical protein
LNDAIRKDSGSRRYIFIYGAGGVDRGNIESTDLVEVIISLVKETFANPSLITFLLAPLNCQVWVSLVPTIFGRATFIMIKATLRKRDESILLVKNEVFRVVACGIVEPFEE